MPQKRLLLAGLGALLLMGVLSAGYHGLWPSGASAPPLAWNAASPSPFGPLLSDADRRFLWEIEHRVVVLDQSFFRPMAGAVVRHDRSRLVEYLAPEFAGWTLDRARADRPELERDYVAVRRCRSEQARIGPLGPSEFIDQLLSYAHEFEDDCQAQIIVVHLAPDSRETLDGAWHGVGRLRLWGHGVGGKPTELVLNLDFELRSIPDDAAPSAGLIRTLALRDELRSTADQFLMEDNTGRCGIDTARLHDNWKCERRDFRAVPGGVYVADYNSDAAMDILVTELDRAVLYANDGTGYFRDVSLEAGLPQVPGAHRELAAWADFDNDGDEDLVLGSALLENRAGRFVIRNFL